jgi:hypothetical protein
VFSFSRLLQRFPRGELQAAGIEGMIHIGDIRREKRFNHPKGALTAGQRVRAQVLGVDTARRRRPVAAQPDEHLKWLGQRPKSRH